MIDVAEDMHGDRDAGSGPAPVALLAAVVAGALICGYAWWAVGRPPFSASATAAVVVPGAAVAALAALTRSHAGGSARRSEPALPRVAHWAALAAVAAVWQLAAYVQAPRGDHPTLSSLANAALDSHAARAAAFVAWLAAVMALVRR